MLSLTPQGQATIEALAQRHGISTGAALAMLQALIEGNGTMAQFSHPEFGGMVQWSQGGMTMVGDMFNHALKAKVDALCSELSGLLASEPGLTRRSSHHAQRQSQGQGSQGLGETSLFVSSGGGWRDGWWPAELGAPAAAGSQNDVRYAYFPATQRLAIQVQGRTTVYDSGDHRITGVSQQQSGDASLTFVSQKGLVRIDELRVVAMPDGEEANATAKSAAGNHHGPNMAESGAMPDSPLPTPAGGAGPTDDIFVKIERLADLHRKGILSEDEFTAKKAELLSRL